MPIGLGAIVPNKLYYFSIKKNDHAKPKMLLQKETERRHITSNNFKGQ